MSEDFTSLDSAMDADSIAVTSPAADTERIDAIDKLWGLAVVGSRFIAGGPGIDGKNYGCRVSRSISRLEPNLSMT